MTISNFVRVGMHLYHYTFFKFGIFAHQLYVHGGGRGGT